MSVQIMRGDCRDDYRALIAQKRASFAARGFEPVGKLHPDLKPHQRHAVEFALRHGCAALFFDTGLGKTFCALEWGRQVVAHTGKPVLMLAPLAVGPQHEREAKRWKIRASYVRGEADMSVPQIWITNYEQLKHVDTDQFAGVILDESSILKSFTGKTTRELIDRFAQTPYRLACTATPAPNDHTEIGTHAEFLGVMRRDDMLVRWFIHDSMNTGEWRLKGHSGADFWSWVASWARAISKPSDIGFSDEGYQLPPLHFERHEIRADVSEDTDGMLFRIPDLSATSIHREKRRTAEGRADLLAGLVADEPTEPWVIWCDTDYEADALVARIKGAADVRGSHTPEIKEQRLISFSTGETRIIITKPSIAGFGLNWQHCAHIGFVGLSFSYESFYQAVRRCWRFGQERSVKCHIVMADTERAIYDVVARKRDDHSEMKSQMVAAMKRAVTTKTLNETYTPKHVARVPAWLKEMAG